MPPYRSVTAALGAGAAIGLFAGAGCSTQDCKNMRANGSPFASLLCGGEGIDAPQPNTPPLSLCQPREVMPVFFSLIDQNDPSLAGLRSAVADLGRPVCLVPKDRTCTSDDQCAVGHCVSGLCPCQTSYSPLTDALGTLLHKMLGYLTPQTASAQLGAIQVLLADPYTKSFLANLSGGGGAQGRDSLIVLLHGLTPSIISAANGNAALGAINKLLNSLVYGSSSVPQSFKDEVKAVMDNTSGMLADSTGIFPPL